MPRIFDNIEQHLLPALVKTLEVSHCADFCVGYFNLRGWKQLDRYIEPWSGGEGQCCRLMVGMQRTPQEELQEAFRLSPSDGTIDNPKAKQLKRKLADDFRRQLMLGVPTAADEAGLRRLAQQLRDKKLVVQLFLRHPLHAKLYLLFRDDFNNPISGYVGSSNLTFAGLSAQGELNVDVLDHDACQKLAAWFEDRWADQFCVDISAELIEVIEESWARETPPTPYEIYLKMAYHLALDARAGLGEYALPVEFRNRLFKFQAEAVKIAARYFNRQGGVLIGDVVGLGKTLMATALAKIIEDDQGISTLIICPPNLKSMWQGYVDKYGLRGKVMSSGMAIKELPEVPARFRLVILDESHNYRNREGKVYRAIKEFLDQGDARCILLSATPYNKTYLDLSAQLRLFVPEGRPLGIRPEKMLREIDPRDYSHYQVAPGTLAEFEHSPHADDWRELMRLFLVRRTRSFILAHYAEKDAQGRSYLRRDDGQPLYFPKRQPKTLKFAVNEQDAGDAYARLYSEPVIDVISRLCLPRYGLGNYLKANAEALAEPAERKLLENLSRAGKRLLGYCRTGLFKRLESSGSAFVQSLDRHILRNYIYLHALEQGLPLPIGTQDADMLDPGVSDADPDSLQADLAALDSEDEAETPETAAGPMATTSRAYKDRAREAYAVYAKQYKKRFKWVRPVLFNPALKRELKTDAEMLTGVLESTGGWDAAQDKKLERLCRLLIREHPKEKVLIFSQFADTVTYLAAELERRGLPRVAGVTGGSHDPTTLAGRFSPRSNEKDLAPGDELRVLVATDVLSEGQNLQDAHIVVNYDLPWAIIRLIQRAGRVDRIGQAAEAIQCYSFLPAEGVERILRLRQRVTQRLRENGEVLGTDEQFFSDDQQRQDLRDLYTEKAGVLDDEAEGEVDLNSEAYAIWSDATRDNAALARKIEAMPEVVFSTKAWEPNPVGPAGVLVYLRTADGNDALTWVDRAGNRVTQSQLEVLRAAACRPDTPTQPRHPDHHDRVQDAVRLLLADEQFISGGLGPKTGARYKAYTRLRAYYEDLKARVPLFADAELGRAVDDLLKYPVREAARDILNRQIKAGLTNDDLARLVIQLRQEDRLSLKPEAENTVAAEPHIICSLGLSEP